MSSILKVQFYPNEIRFIVFQGSNFVLRYISGVLLGLSRFRIWCLELLLWCGFDPWPGNLCMLRVWPKKGGWGEIGFCCFCCNGVFSAYLNMFFQVGFLFYLQSKLLLLLLFIYLFIYLFWSFCLLGPHQWHMEVPRLGVELELQLPAYATATATPMI